MHDSVSVIVGPDNEIGLVAENPILLALAMKELEPEWSQLTEESKDEIHRGVDIDQAIENKILDHTALDQGDIKKGLSSAIQHLDIRYDSPMTAHAAMEPRAGVAHWKMCSDGQARCEIWTGSQDPWLVQVAIAKILDLKKENVEVNNHRMGGAFGGRILCQPSIAAAWLSRAAGKPVKVQWSREEEFRHNYVGPQFSTRIKAGLDNSGKITYWHHQMVGSPILISSMFVPKSICKNKKIIKYDKINLALLLIFICLNVRTNIPI